MLDAVVARHDDAFQLSVLSFGGGRAAGAATQRARGAAVRPISAAATSCFRSSRPRTISALNVLAGPRRRHRPGANGAQAEVRLDCNGAALTARLTAKSVQRLALAPGLPVYAVIKSVSFERS